MRHISESWDVSLTGALGAALLATPAAALIGSSVRLFDPAAYVAALLDRRDVHVRSAGFRATGHEDRSGGRAQAGLT